MSNPITTKVLRSMPSSPLCKKGDAPSRKKSLGYYAAVKPGRGEGAKAGGGMTKKGVAKYRRDNPGSKLKTKKTIKKFKKKKKKKKKK
jgi:hypothetical protein